MDTTGKCPVSYGSRNLLLVRIDAALVEAIEGVLQDMREKVVFYTGGKREVWSFERLFANAEGAAACATAALEMEDGHCLQIVLGEEYLG